MKPTKPSLQKMLFACVIVCSVFCSIHMNAVHHNQSNHLKNASSDTQIEEVVLPDVFAVKNLIEKILSRL